MSKQIKGDDRESVKEIIAILSNQNITPYDLLLSLDKKDIVPDEVVANRKSRILARDKEETPKGYIKNAIEDLEKLEFDRKKHVLTVLRKIIGIKQQLSGYDEFSEYSSKYWGFLVAALAIVIVCFIHFK